MEVLWIHNQQWKAWERRLPGPTHSKLMQDRKGRRGTCKGVHHKTVMEREKFDGELEESLYGGVSCRQQLFSQQHNLRLRHSQAQAVGTVAGASSSPACSAAKHSTNQQPPLR